MCSIPQPILALYKSAQWELLAFIFLKAAEQDSQNYWDKYYKQVGIIEAEFTILSGAKPFVSNIRYWRRKVAYYIHVLGSDFLLNDMRTVFKSYRPKSLVYFLHNNAGNAARWELLYREKLQKRYEAEKAFWQEAFDSLKLSTKINKVEPEWVETARMRYRHLDNTISSLHGNTYLDAKREMSRIANNLKTHGFTLEK